MFKNYFTIALRSFGRQKVYAVINTLGLAVGITSAILIFLYINNELTFDKDFPEPEDTYALGLTFTDSEGNSYPQTYTPGGWSSALQRRLNGVDGNMRLLWLGGPASFHYEPDDRIVLSEDIYWVQDNFHEFMYFPVVKGSKEKALQMNGIALSESSAMELFGNSDPMGEMVIIKHPAGTNNEPLQLEVTAVFEDYPPNTHLRPKYLVNYQALKPYIQGLVGLSMDELEEHMFSGGFRNYIHTNGALTQEEIESEMREMISEVMENNPSLSDQLQGGVLAPTARTVADIHFDTEFSWVTEGGGNIVYIYTFATVAFLILLVATINYMNLATARSARRSREVGLRKTFGSERRQLFLQFMIESLLTVLVAFVVALILVAIFLPKFNILAGLEIKFTEIFSPTILSWLVLLLCLTAFLAGLYPALFLSGFNTIEVLKGKFSFSKGSNFLRRGLIGFQYIVALVLLILTFIVVRQMNMMQLSKLNEAGDQILSIRHGGTAELSKYPTFKNLIRQDPDLQEITFGNHLPRLDFFGSMTVPYRLPEITEEEQVLNTFKAGFEFIDIYNLEIVAGRTFEVGNSADSSNVILNESACRAFGKTPEEMIGTSISNPRVRGYNNFDNEEIQTGQVIGVVRDFPYQSAYQAIDPLVINARPHPMDRILYIKLPEGQFQEKISYIEKVWKQVYPGVGLSYWFVNDEFNRMYAAEQRVAKLSTNFSVLAILITCVGLFGLASFITQQKTKEIGIRKALGATNIQIFSSFIMLFLKVMFWAGVIAVPVAFFLSRYWLQNFALKVPLDWTVFVLSFGIIAVLTIITVGYESLKASRTDPVNSLRYE